MRELQDDIFDLSDNLYYLQKKAGKKSQYLEGTSRNQLDRASENFASLRGRIEKFTIGKHFIE